MERPLVTVVIPVYRVEAYLDRCVSSVVEQTYKHLQIILVDDGSDDGCPAMCDAWARTDSRISVLHQSNAGAAAARNAGIDQAAGEYLFFFDSEDYVDHTLVEQCVTLARQHHADTVLYGRWDETEDGQKLETPVHAPMLLYRGEAVTQQLLPGLFTYRFGLGVGTCGRMYRTKNIKEHALRFQPLISEDAYFTLEFFRTVEAACILPRCLYGYCARSSSQSHTYRKDRQERNNEFLLQSLSYLEQAAMPEVVARHVTVRYHFYTIAAMKQVAAAKLPKQEKKQALLAMFRDPVLRGTLRPGVLKEEKGSLQVFFGLLRLRAYGLCRYILEKKANSQN